MKYIAILLISTLTAYGQQEPFPASSVPDRIILTFNGDPATSQAVTWRTDTLTQTGIAELKLASPHPGREDTALVIKAVNQLLPFSAFYHTATFSKLQPSTQYMYRVGNGQIWSEWFHFTTAAASFKPFSFIYLGDSQNDHKELWSRAIRAAYSKAPQSAFMLHAGDLINRTNTDKEWGEWFYAGGWIYGMMPTIATPGNHEFYAEAGQELKLTLTKHWRPMFAFPENGPAGLEELAYYVDYQQVRVISICSQSFLLNPADSISQVAWVEDLLRNNPNKWTIITMHHPIFSSAGGRDNKSLRDAFQPMFDKYGVDLVLTGHDHTYGRGTGENSSHQKKQALKGPVYVTSVSGPKMYVPSLGTWQQRAAANTQLYQVISLTENSISYKSYTVTGQLYDAFRLEKKGRMLIEEIPALPENVTLPPYYQQKLSIEEKAAYEKKKQEYLKRR